MGEGKCCRCVMCTLFKVIIAIVLLVGVVVLVLWLVFRPKELKVHVVDASLSRFDLNSTTSLMSYDLSLDVSIRNPNTRVAFYYDHLEAVAAYYGYAFGFDKDLPLFFLDREKKATIRPEFEGRRQAMALPESTAEAYRREKEEEEGWFHVEVKVYARVRFKVWFVKTNTYKPKFTCDLKLPVPSRGREPFARTRCDVDFF